MIPRPPISTLFPYTTLFRSFAFPKQEWDGRSQEVRARPLNGQHARAYARMFFGNAERVELDSQGRRSEEHTSELQSRFELVCRLLLEKKKVTAEYRVMKDVD